MPPEQEGISATADDAPFARAANVEYCCFRCFSPHDGQVTPSALELRTSFSNDVPQSSQRYSKIGIRDYSTSSKAILSTQSRTSEVGAAKLFTRIENASGPSVRLSA